MVIAKRRAVIVTVPVDELDRGLESDVAAPDKIVLVEPGQIERRAN